LGKGQGRGTSKRRELAAVRDWGGGGKQEFRINRRFGPGCPEEGKEVRIGEMGSHEKRRKS